MCLIIVVLIPLKFEPNVAIKKRQTKSDARKLHNNQHDELVHVKLHDKPF